MKDKSDKRKDNSPSLKIFTTLDLVYDLGDVFT